jgi:hypothetical protein
MKRAYILTIAAAGVSLSTGPASAHHSFAAEFDRDMPITRTRASTSIRRTTPVRR